MRYALRIFHIGTSIVRVLRGDALCAGLAIKRIFILALLLSTLLWIKICEKILYIIVLLSVQDRTSMYGDLKKFKLGRLK